MSMLDIEAFILPCAFWRQFWVNLLTAFFYNEMR